MDLREFGLTGKDVDAIRLSAFLQRFEQYDQEGELFEAIGTVLENRDLQDSVIKLVQEFRHQKNLKYA